MSDERAIQSSTSSSPPQAEALPLAGSCSVDSSGEAEPRRSRGGAQPDESKVSQHPGNASDAPGTAAPPDSPDDDAPPSTPRLSGGGRPGSPPSRSRRALTLPAPQAVGGTAITPEQQLLILDAWRRCGLPAGGEVGRQTESAAADRPGDASRQGVP